MADICPVCKEEIGFWQVDLGNVIVHPSCQATYSQDPEKYGEKVIEITDIDEETKKAQIEVVKERQQSDKEINDKSVHVISFDMPFGDMVMFMVKWAIASIPAFIILFIIFGIFFAIFGALFF